MTDNNSDSTDSEAVTADKPTDLSEREFNDYMEKVLENHFGEENVHREVVLESQRRPDFVVDTIFGTAMVEAEDRAKDAIGGWGQAYLYASHEMSAYGIVLFPEETEEPDLEYLINPIGFMQYEFKPGNPREAKLRMVGESEVPEQPEPSDSED